MFAYCLNNPANGCDPCGTCFHRWDFWNHCEKCSNKTTEDYLKEMVDCIVYTSINVSVMSAVLFIPKVLHYSRNLINKTYTEAELDAMEVKPLGPSEDKFHQNNQINGRNRKYVIGHWFSSEVVLYADGTINNTPEDRGTLNVYYGNHWFGKYIIHGAYDVLPYMLWGNSPDDSTTIVDRITMGLGG